MTFGDFFGDVTGPVVLLAKSHPIVALAALLFLGLLIYRKPLFYLGLLFLGFILIVVFYAVMQVSGSGVSQKERLIEKSKNESSGQEDPNTQ